MRPSDLLPSPTGRGAGGEGRPSGLGERTLGILASSLRSAPLTPALSPRGEGVNAWAGRFLQALLASFLLFSVAFSQGTDPASRGPELPPALEARASSLGSGLRCPVCRGLPISDSPADLARTMMAELRAQVLAGRTDAQIMDGFVASYGEGVLLAPRPRGLGLIVWLGPLTAILLGGLGLAHYLHRASRAVPDDPDPVMLARARHEIERAEASGERS